MKNAYKSEHRVQNDVLVAAMSRVITAMTRRSLAPDWIMACERYGADDSLRGITLADAEKALRIVVGLFDQQKIFPLLFPITGNPAQAITLPSAGTSAMNRKFVPQKALMALGIEPVRC